MSGAFDAYEYLEYLGRRWRSAAVTCGVALALALTTSLLLPNRYTATASVLIDPPAGSDLRTATAVSPVYLESLRTYEHFANSDSLFQRAAERFHLVEGEAGASMEHRKRRMLQVSKLRDTRVLQIAVTLGDAKKAQELAQYLAEETVKMSQAVLRDAEGDLVEDARKQMGTARMRLDAEQKAWRDFASTVAVDALKAEIDSLSDVSTLVHRNSMAADADVAEWAERVKALSAADSGAAVAEVARAKRELRATQARAAALESQKRVLDANLRSKGEALARQIAQKDQLETQVREATGAYATALARLQEVRSAAGYRGERLKVIDPGVVPERPSFPNLPLNLVAALLAGVVVTLVHLSIAFSYQRRKRETWRGTPLRVDQ